MNAWFQRRLEFLPVMIVVTLVVFVGWFRLLKWYVLDGR